MPDLPPASHPDPFAAVRTWLLLVFGMVFAMVLLGGITRLTGSGLSMAEWRPLMGTLPPLSEAEWQRVFARYQQTPQYLLVNDWMVLSDFQQIFFWEWLHRLWGRLIGVVFLLPYLWFWARGRLRNAPRGRIFFAFVLGGLQGLLGWFMVKSGLAGDPEVSHYRLAAHLSAALLVACWLLWLAWDLSPSARLARAPSRRWWLRSWSLLALVSVQMVWGALMAGKRAGLAFRSFPDYYGDWVPEALKLTPNVAHALVASPECIHFVHRTLGWIVGAWVLWFAVGRFREAARPSERRVAVGLVALCVVQITLGALTVMHSVPIPLASAHQGVGVLLLCACLYATWLAQPATPLRREAHAYT